MAQQVIQLDQEKLSCSICLDLLKDPVTIPCGHSYCMSCIKSYWDKDGRKKTTSCPQCRQVFTPRPTLVKNTMLAELVDELKKVGLQAASPDIARAGYVACDFCTGSKAFKSCLVCLASYCEQHLQPHYDVAALRKHKLVEATSKVQENEYKGHNTVSVGAERVTRQKQLRVSQQKIQQRIQDRETHIEALQQRVEAISCCADKAVKDSEKIFTDLICLLEKRSFEVNQQIRSKQKMEVSQIREVEKKLKQEITELKTKSTELEQLSHTDDHHHFLNNYPSLSSQSTSADLQSQQYFEDVTAAVSKARDQLQAVLNEEWVKISLKITRDDVLLHQQEPKTRPEFIKFARQITLDPITANTFVSLSKKNRKATLLGEEQLWIHPEKFWIHPEQFVKWWQVLSTDGLTGRCYWEVKWHGKVLIAVAYRNIPRTGSRNECGFGNNNKSWALECCSSGYTFRHKNISTFISGPQCSRIGVYLDHSAGILSFFSICGAMTLLHQVQTKFTQPLYPGFWLPDTVGDAAEFCELKKTEI